MPNRLTNMVDEVGATVYTYTSGGELSAEDGPFASDTVTNYYWNRLRIGLGLQQPAGFWTNAFGYDDAKRLTSVASPAGTFSYAYDPLRIDLIDQISLPTGSIITNLYDGNSRLLGTWLKTSGGTILDAATYGYNVGNQRLTYTNATATNVTYQYDPFGQLQSATSSTSTENRAYLYDAAWNLSKLTNNGTASIFSVDGDNEMTHINGTGYGYDGNGNLTTQSTVTGQTTTYSYDDENRLAGVVNAAGTSQTTFLYDGLGRLREQLQWTNSSGGGGGGDVVVGGVHPDVGGWTQTGGIEYIYDGNRVIQERNTGNTPTVSYTRGNDLSGTLGGAGGIGGLLARSGNFYSGNFTNHNYYHADGLGNIAYLETTNQGLAASYRYDPFGNLLVSSGTLATTNSYRFSSKEFVNVPNGGLYYYLYRFYSPPWQRWLNRDPIQEDGGLNLYEFVDNDPVDGTDPSGLIIQFDPKFPPDAKQHFQNCICALGTSPKGKELLDKANKPDVNVLIQPGPYANTIPWPVGSPIIQLNPDDPLGLGPLRNKLDPDEIPPDSDGGCASVLAHELGHAFNPNDPSSKDEDQGGSNVYDNENPVRKYFGIPPRTHIGKTQVPQ